jgi:hypothetical protein
MARFGWGFNEVWMEFWKFWKLCKYLDLLIKHKKKAIKNHPCGWFL